MKGKLIIQPGFESGSQYCGKCTERILSDIFCKRFYVNLDFYPNGKATKRCQACLDAEVKENQK